MPEPVTILGVGGGMIGLLVHLAKRHFETAKEVTDVILAAILLVTLSPIIAVCGAIIKLSSRGPVFYSQWRVGKDGELFRIFKLRTMYMNCEKVSGVVWARRGDPRVVPACRWMRRAHLDELPQLVNVIKGDMSLVGPRPERPEIMSQLKRRYPEVTRRLSVRPGITGLAQVRNGYDTDIESFRAKLASDLEYIAKRRWMLEISIMMRTVTKLYDRAAR